MAGRLVEYDRASSSSDDVEDARDRPKRPQSDNDPVHHKSKTKNPSSDDLNPGDRRGQKIDAPARPRERDFEREEGSHGRSDETSANKRRTERPQGRGRKEDEEWSQPGSRDYHNTGRYRRGGARDEAPYSRRGRSRSRSREGRRGDDRMNDRRRDHDEESYDGRRNFEGRRDRDRRFEDSRRRPTTEELAKLPAYVNPNRVNINQVIQQQEKRKLLWAKKEEATVVDKNEAMWGGVSFAGDADGAVASKFKKLMGLKGEPSAASQPTSQATDDPADGTAPSTSQQPSAVLSHQQDELFRNLDRQYQMARLSAHTQRGVGLGFNSR